MLETHLLAELHEPNLDILDQETSTHANPKKYIWQFKQNNRVLARNFKTCVRDSLLGANWRPRMKNMRTGHEVLEYDKSSRAPDRGSFCVFDAKKTGKNSSSLKPMRHENAH